MRKLASFGAAIVAASLGSHVLAADMAAEAKGAQKEYQAAVARAKADFDNAIAVCRKGAEDRRLACYREARRARRQARDAADDAHTKATRKPDPSPGA